MMNDDDDKHDDGVSRGLLGTKWDRKCENDKKNLTKNKENHLILVYKKIFVMF